MEEFKLTIPGFTIAGKTWGHHTLPPLLAVHGWLDNANSFDLLAPYLAKKFHIIAIDLPGHGLSSHLHDGGVYHFIDGIFILINIISALGLSKTHLLGHSLGACLASLLAGIAPDRLHSVTLIEGLGPFAQPAEACQEQLTNYVNQLSLKKYHLLKHYSSFELAALARAKRGLLSLELVKCLGQRGISEQQGQFFWHHDRRLSYASPLKLTETQILSCLANINVPTCLILSKQASLFKELDIQQRIAAIKNLVIYKEAGGHHLHMENPSAVAQRLLDFYKSMINAEKKL